MYAYIHPHNITKQCLISTADALNFVCVELDKAINQMLAIKSIKTISVQFGLPR